MFHVENSFSDDLQSEQRSKWIKAMNEEITFLKELNTWELVVPSKNANIVSSKWTFKFKRDSDGTVQRFKTRLVARGYSQKYGEDYDEVFAPVLRQTTLRNLLSIAGARKMSVVRKISVSEWRVARNHIFESATRI